MKLDQLKKRQNTLINLITRVGGKNNIRKWTDELMNIDAQLEVLLDSVIKVGSRVLRKNGSLIAGTVASITGSVAVVKWDKNHNFKKVQELKNLQLHSEKNVNKIANKKTAKAFAEFKKLVILVGENWYAADGKNGSIYPFWAVEKGYIELQYNDNVNRRGGVSMFRISQKGLDFAKTI